MSDILKRSMAPLTTEAWQAIEAQARETLSGNLSGRRVATMSGPHGWNYAAVNLGTVSAAKTEAPKGVAWGLRDVQPLAEIRVPFTLAIWDLDNLTRGSATPDLDAVADAARTAAAFEETAVYLGFPAAGIKGLLPSAASKPIAFAATAATFAETIETAVHTLQASGIGGPYDLVLGRKPYQTMMAEAPQGYPLSKQVNAITGGTVHWSPVVDGGVLVSRRGGDFELTVGQDFSIGYHSHDTGKVNLFITESLTFRVLEPRAVVELKLKK